jgi:imidazole glycerol phosphate synthase subunit HisF
VVYAGDINILGGHVQTVNKNTEILEVAGKKIGLNINAEKTKNMVTTRNQNVGQNHNINIDNSSFERVEQFTYLGTTLRNQNSIHVENENRLNSGNAEYFSSFFLRHICRH